MTSLSVPSNPRHFAQVQASGYSPVLHRKKSSGILSNSSRLLSWMTESTAPSAAVAFKDKGFTGSNEPAFQHDRPSMDAPQSILVRPDTIKNTIDKVTSFSYFGSVVPFISMPYVSCLSPSASKVSAIPHWRRLPTSETSDLLLVSRDSDHLQMPPQTGSTRSLGPFPHTGKRWTGDNSQRRKSFCAKEGPWNGSFRPEL